MNTNSLTAPPSVIAESPCPGNGCMPVVGDFPSLSPNPNVPSLQDIANYNYMNPAQQWQQKEQLRTSGNQVPWMPQQTGKMPPQPAPLPQASQLSPITSLTQPMPVTLESIQYLNGFLRTQIGRPVRVEFLIGTNTMIDRTGTLLAVGANYILLNEAESDDVLACDLYNIKFVKFYY